MKFIPALISVFIKKKMLQITFEDLLLLLLLSDGLFKNENGKLIIISWQKFSLDLHYIFQINQESFYSTELVSADQLFHYVLQDLQIFVYDSLRRISIENCQPDDNLIRNH